MKTYTVNDLFEELYHRFGEQIENSGPRKPELLVTLCAKMLIDERNKSEYLKQRLEHYEHKAV